MNKRAAVALMIIVLVLAGFAICPQTANAQDPPPTHTPTPDYTAPLTLSSGQPARVVYEVSAGDYVLGFLAFVQTVLLALILYTMTRNRLNEG